jgi:hypothetical protein
MYRWDVGYEPRWLHLYVSKERLRDATDTHTRYRKRSNYLIERVKTKPITYRLLEDIEDEIEVISLRCDSAILIQNEHYEYIELLEAARRRWVATRTIQAAWKKA